MQNSMKQEPRDFSRGRFSQAMEELGIVNVDDLREINIREDDRLNDSINTSKVIVPKSFEYTDEEIFRPEPQITRQGVVYKRDRQKAVNSLVHADFKCEVDPTHETFEKKSDGLPYLEAHHLITMSE